jgi:signal transduction histidine kinase
MRSEVVQSAGVSRPRHPRASFFTTKEQGPGLGLAIAHEFAEANGGVIWAEAGVVGGATVVLRLSRDGPAGA